MALRFNDAERSLSLSVRDLAEWGPLTGDLRATLAFSPAARMEAGRLAHSDWQEAQAEEHESYGAEVPVKVTWVVDGWSCTVRGRVDGLLQEGEGWIVEEVKSTTLPTSRIAGSSARDWPSWSEQLELYLALFHAMGREDLSGRLVIISIADGGRVSLSLTSASAEVEVEVKRRLGEIVARREEQLRWWALRRGSGVPFAHEEARPHQVEMSAEVRDAFARGQQLLQSAPTGSGKSASALHGALAEVARRGARLFYATAKGTQREVVERTLSMMAERGMPLRALSITARDKVCLNEVVDCRPEVCPWARGHFDRVESAGLLERAFEGAGEREVMEGPIEELPHAPNGIFTTAWSVELGRRHTVCPHALAMQLVERADLVIGDYNYPFDPGLSFSSLFTASSEPWAVVVDEAHNLVERGRGYGSPRLDASAAEEAREWLEELHGEAASGPIELCSDLERLISASAVDPDPEVEGEWETELDLRAFDELNRRAQGLSVDYLLLSSGVSRGNDPWILLTRDLKRFTEILLGAGEETVHVFDNRDGEAVRLACLDPSRFIQRQLKPFFAALFLSATLRPMTYHRDLLGLDPDRVVEAVHPSPFPPERMGVLLATRISTIYKDRAAHREKTVQLIRDLVEAFPGNVAVYYSSYAMLASIAEAAEVEGVVNLVQRRGMGMRSAERWCRASRSPASDSPFTGCLEGSSPRGSISPRGP